MISLRKPSFDVRTVFLDCTSTVNEAMLKADLEACIDDIEAAETDFKQRFPLAQIHLITPNAWVSAKIGKNHMKVVYNYRMVQIKPGKKYYNKIKALARFGICPLCSVREVDTLDHYLPKMKFPIFAVTPITLIPACTPCNKKKLVAYPKTPEEQTLHPYFDNIENDSWLSARVRRTNPITFNFFVDPPEHWDQIKIDRVKMHFNAFNLNALFSSKANQAYRGAKRQLTKLYNLDPDELVAHLSEAYVSQKELGQNSWQSVMYKALLDDQWFCNGGVLV